MSDRALLSSLSIERDGEARCTGCAWLGLAELCVVVSVERPPRMRYRRSSRRFERNLDGQVRIQGVRDPLPGPAVFTQRDFANTVSNTIRRLVAILWVPHRPPINVESELPKFPVELTRVGLTMQRSGSRAARRSM